MRTKRAQGLFNSPGFIALGIFLSRALPRKPLYWLSRQVARYLCWRQTDLFKTLYGNYEHVMASDGAPDAPPELLAQMVENSIAHAGRTYVDMFRGSMEDLRRGKIAIRIDETDWARAREALTDERGTVMVGPHLSNFDLASQWIASQGIVIKALSLAGPSPGNKMLNALRRHRGIEMRPVGVKSLRWANRLLKQGGVILTGVDRPLSPDDKPIGFFGGDARLPTGHVRLAMQTNSRILVAACTMDDDGVYPVHFSEPLEMERLDSRKASIVHNTSRVLRVLEGMIRIAPDQWLMFVPVWPDEKRHERRGAERI